MTTREEREARFVQSVMGDQRKFPWPWTKTAEFVLELRKGAQLEGALAGQGIPQPQGTPEAENEDIVRGLLQVQQQQQATVAAAEAEGRTLRMQLDQSKQQLQNLFLQSQQQQGQMQQMQAQAQQAVQQAQAQADQARQMAGPEIQKAQQTAAMAQQEATQARIEKSKLEQLYEQTRRAVLDYKGSVMQAVAQDPVTMAEAQQMQQQQQAAMQAQQMQQPQQAQQMQQPQQAQQAPQGEGMTAQASAGQTKTAQSSPVSEIARAVAGQGERAGYRRALAEQYLSNAAQQGAKAGQGGAKLPFDSLAAEVLKQGHGGQQAVKVAMLLNAVANDLRQLQGGKPRPPDSSVLEKIAQTSYSDMGPAGYPWSTPNPEIRTMTSPKGEAIGSETWAEPQSQSPAIQTAGSQIPDWLSNIWAGMAPLFGGGTPTPPTPGVSFPQFTPWTPEAPSAQPSVAPASAAATPAAPRVFENQETQTSESVPAPEAPASQTAPAASPLTASPPALQTPPRVHWQPGEVTVRETPSALQAPPRVHWQPGEVTVRETPSARPSPAPHRPTEHAQTLSGGGTRPGAQVQPKPAPSPAPHSGNIVLSRGSVSAKPAAAAPVAAGTASGQQAVQHAIHIQPGAGMTILKGPGAQVPAPAAGPTLAHTSPDWSVNRAKTWISQHPGRAPTPQETGYSEVLYPEQGGPVYRR